MMSSGLVYLGEIEDLAMSLAEILLLLEINLKRPFNSHERNATLSQREKCDQCEDTCIHHWDSFPSDSRTRMVLWRFELTLLNISLPTMVAMVGKTRAPHRMRVADTWSASGLVSAGILGTGQPIPAHDKIYQQKLVIKNISSDEQIYQALTLSNWHFKNCQKINWFQILNLE